jgi:hypothetical protein
MNIFREYANLVQKGVKNLPQILDGARTKVMQKFNMLEKDEQKEIVRRMDICLQCPYNSENATNGDAYKNLFGRKYQHHRPDLHCSLCGCNLELKTSSLDSACGGRSHNENYPKAPVEVRWTEYERNSSGS